MSAPSTGQNTSTSKSQKEKSDVITPLSPGDNSNSRLKDTVVGGYHTFGPNISGLITHEDSHERDFDSKLLEQYIQTHPTQSIFSLYSMQNVHRLSKLSMRASSMGSNVPKSHRIYTFWGFIYRKCCYTRKGMKFILYSNTLLVLLNFFLIIYEVVLLVKSKNYLDAHLPITFFICDLIITLILIIEVLLHWYIAYMCSCNEYLCNSTRDNQLDALIMILSVVCLSLYVYDFRDSKNEHSESIDNLVFLVLRITRDVIRITRCYLFFRLLHENLAFDWDKLEINNDDDFHVHMHIPGQNLKSVKSDLLWQKYVKEKELHPTVTMLKVAPSALVVTGIPENKPTPGVTNINNDFDSINSDFGNQSSSDPNV